MERCSTTLADSELRVVHFIQPGGGASGEIRVACAASRREVRGWPTSHHSQGLAHPSLATLSHYGVHGEAQAAEQWGVGRQGADGGGGVGEAVGATGAYILIRLPTAV